VSIKECEQAVINDPKFVQYQKLHSKREDRFSVLGVTDGRRKLTIVITVRDEKIRVISALDQSRRERRFFTAMLSEKEVKT